MNGLLQFKRQRRLPRLALLAAFVAVAGLSACQREIGDPIAGTWQAVVLNKAGEEVAFKLDLTREGEQVSGALVNGDDRVVSTSGSFDGQTLRLRYDFYDGDLTATLEGDELRGEFSRQWRKETLRRQLRARRGVRQAGSKASSGAEISGDWLLRVGEGDKQRIWRAAFRQQGSEVTGTIIPVSGDWGTLTGTFANGQLALSRFDGINAHLFKAKLTERGTLEGLLDSERKVVAERAASAQRDSTLAPPDPNSYTSMKNPAEPFHFKFFDLGGKIVASTDERFRNKVVIVTVTGSWCPNCHDEAPVLNELYDRYHTRGLEIVGLSFEYTGNWDRDHRQVKTFVARHKIKYPMLLAGSTEEAEQKLSQLANFSAYPTTIFIGRDGLVKKIHAGFEGPATGERFTRLKAELDALVRELLEGEDS
jgi:thiol-disulfide isomerase/thioredoxin